MRAKRAAPPARCELLDFREKFGRHSRGGEKAKIAAARFCCLILGGFRGELGQGFSAREANSERVDQLSLGFDNFRRGLGRGGKKQVRGAEPDGLRKERALRFIKIPAFLFGRSFSAMICFSIH